MCAILIPFEVSFLALRLCMAPSRIFFIQQWWFLMPLFRQLAMHILSWCFVQKLSEHGSISEVLKLPLKSVVLLRSVREPRINCLRSLVTLKESLASYRRGLGIPATCLQLGAWKSKLVQNLELSAGLVRPIQHENGIPLLFKAMNDADRRASYFKF